MKAIREKARQLLVFILIVFSVLLGITTSASAVEYEYTELLPPGWIDAFASGINDSGAVVGSGHYGTGYSKGFLYNAGGYTDIIPPGWIDAYAYRINDSGAVVGYGYAGTTDKGFLYNAGVYTDIIPPGRIYASASGINDSGAVVGTGYDGTTTKGFLYSAGVYTDIIPPGLNYALALGINDSGAVVGYGYDGSTDKGFLYSAGVYTDIIPPGLNYAYALDINDSGEVAGWGYDGTTWKGFIATPKTEDTTPPEVSIVFPQANQALQDGITFQAQATDTSGIDKVFFYVREPDGGEGTPIGYEDLEATFNTATGYWEYPFDTTVLQDGYYVTLAKAIDNAGNEGLSAVVPFSIRNWAVIQMMPSTKNNKAGRTMSIKFSIRIAASIDSAQPFVYNEDLEIRIYGCDNTSCSSKTLMQTSVYGTKSTDYKIDLTAQLYQTNFQTTKTPSQYLVEIWRPSNNFMVESFTFKTVK